MDRLLYNLLLYDFYGELLTAKQRETYHMHYCDDMSLSEIGDKLGISRQAVNFSIKQALRALEDYDVALKLVEQHTLAASHLSDLRDALERQDFTKSIKILHQLENLL